MPRRCLISCRLLPQAMSNFAPTCVCVHIHIYIYMCGWVGGWGQIQISVASGSEGRQVLPPQPCQARTGALESWACSEAFPNGSHVPAVEEGEVQGIPSKS